MMDLSLNEVNIHYLGHSEVIEKFILQMKLYYS